MLYMATRILCRRDFPEFMTTYLNLDHTSLVSSNQYSFHFTALKATHHGRQTATHREKQGPIQTIGKLFTNAGSTFSHAIKDQTLFLCIIDTEKV